MGVSLFARAWHVRSATVHTNSHVILMLMSNNINVPSLMSLAQHHFFSRRTLMSKVLHLWHVQYSTQHTHSNSIALWMSNNISVPSLVSLAQHPFQIRRTPMPKVCRHWHVQLALLGRVITKGSWFGIVCIRPVNFASLGPAVWPAGVTKYDTCGRGANHLHVHNWRALHPRATIDPAPCSARQTPSVCQIWCR